MRGKAAAVADVQRKAGITPAYAGKSTTCHSGCPPEQDHPRLCGEKLLFILFLILGLGSPPPMRGKGMRTTKASPNQRITPAYAGKSRFFAYCSTCTRDHPRLCGEKIFSLFSHAPHTGSPPPMRGKVNQALPACVPCRITPAYAGKSQCVETSLKLHRDHPRLCGEKVHGQAQRFLEGGSPPPMRGKACHEGGTPLFGRITPAYAGKSFRLWKKQPILRDHPRLCGEKHGRS